MKEAHLRGGNKEPDLGLCPDDSEVYKNRAAHNTGLSLFLGLGHDGGVRVRPLLKERWWEKKKTSLRSGPHDSS
jgi:hypothetical protein